MKADLVASQEEPSVVQADYGGPSGSGKTRIGNLTGLRGFAAFWVLLLHYFGKFNMNLFNKGYLGVDVFFVLSGFVLALVYLPKLPGSFRWSWLKAFLSRRFAKLYPMHLLTFAVLAIGLSAGRHMNYRFLTGNIDNSFRSAIYNLLMVHAYGLTSRPSWNYPSWSVSAEWFAYTFVFAPLAFGLRKVRVGFVASIAALLWCSFLFLCIFVLGKEIGETGNFGILRIVPEFAGGYLLYRIIRSRGAGKGDLLTAAGILLIGAVVAGPRIVAVILLPAVMMLLAGLYAGGRFSNLVFGNRLMIALGDASYSIYLLQVPVHIGLSMLLSRFGVSMVRSGLWDSTGVICVLLAGLVAFRTVEEPLRLRLLRTLHA